MHAFNFLDSVEICYFYVRDNDFKGNNVSWAFIGVSLVGAALQLCSIARHAWNVLSIFLENSDSVTALLMSISQYLVEVFFT